MKICLLNDSWKPIWGGGQEHIWQLANHLVANHNCVVDIVVPALVEKSGKKFPQEELFHEGKLRVRRIGPSFVFPQLWGRLTFIWAYFWYCLTHRDYDIYHSQYYSTSILLLPIKFLTGKKVFFTLHGVGVKMLGAGVLNLIIPFISNFFLYTLRYDQLETAAISSILPEKQDQVVVIGNGVNLEEFQGKARKEDKNHFRVLWVGRKYDPVKGLTFLKEAIVHLKNAYPKIQLKIVSNRSHEEVVNEYFQSDLFVLPSLSEGLPLTILEAMAAKLPIVASRVGDIPNLVKDHKTGYLVEPGNSTDLASKIAQAIKSPHLKSMGEAGYQLVKEKYTWDKVAKKQYDLYQKVLAKKD